MIEHRIGVRSSRMLEFKRLDEDFFPEDRRSGRMPQTKSFAIISGVQDNDENYAQTRAL